MLIEDVENAIALFNSESEDLRSSLFVDATEVILAAASAGSRASHMLVNPAALPLIPWLRAQLREEGVRARLVGFSLHFSVHKPRRTRHQDAGYQGDDYDDTYAR